MTVLRRRGTTRRRRCAWPECEHLAGVSLEGRDGELHWHCGQHHVLVERLLRDVPPPAPTRKSVIPRRRGRS